MSGFSLINFIKTKQNINYFNREEVVSSLLLNTKLNDEEIDIISNWYSNLNSNEKKYLLMVKSFQKALKNAPKRQILEPLNLDDVVNVFQNTNRFISHDICVWIAKSFYFPKVFLPSGVEIQVDKKTFLKELKNGIDAYPNSMQILSQMAKKIKGDVYVMPENGEDLSYIFSDIKNAVFFNSSLSNEEMMMKLLCEIGHIADAELLDNKGINNYSLSPYAWMAFQEGRKEYFKLKVFNKDSEYKNLYEFIRQKVLNHNVGWDYDAVEKKTGDIFKNEVVSLYLLDKVRLAHVLNRLGRDGICNYESIFSNIQSTKDAYTANYPFSHSPIDEREIVKDQVRLSLKKPLFKKYFSHKKKREPRLFSRPFCEELMDKSGFISNDENLNIFAIGRMCFLHNVESKNDIIAAISCKGMSSARMQMVQSFYQEKGVNFVFKNGYLVVDKPFMVDKVCRLINNFFNHREMEEAVPVWEFETDLLGKKYISTLASSLMKKEIPFVELDGSVFVEKDYITHKRVTNKANDCYLVDEVYSSPEEEELMRKRYQAVGLNMSVQSTDDDIITYRLTDREYCLYSFLKELTTFAREYVKKDVMTLRGVIPFDRYMPEKAKTLSESAVGENGKPRRIVSSKMLRVKKENQHQKS